MVNKFGQHDARLIVRSHAGRTAATNHRDSNYRE
jgi:hypothetical protein